MDIAAKNSINQMSNIHESLGKAIEMQVIGMQSQLRRRKKKKIKFKK